MTTININLLPEEMRPISGGSGLGGSMPNQDAMKPIIIGAVVALVIGAIPTVITSAYLEPKMTDLADQESLVDQEIAKYNTTLNSLKAIADNKEVLRQQLGTLQSVAGGSTLSLADMLNELRALTPANLWFEGVSTDSVKGTMQVTGAALDYGSVAYFQRNLQQSDFFEDPLLQSTAMSEGTARGVNVVKFTMDVGLRKAKKG